MTALEEVKRILSCDICEWCEAYADDADVRCTLIGKPKLCDEAKAARAEDLYNRVVKPLEDTAETCKALHANSVEKAFEMQDAAEFESRVAEKILKDNDGYLEAAAWEALAHKITRDIDSYILKLARLAVEAEMEKEQQ